MFVKRMGFKCDKCHIYIMYDFNVHNFQKSISCRMTDCAEKSNTMGKSCIGTVRTDIPVEETAQMRIGAGVIPDLLVIRTVLQIGAVDLQF